MLDTFIHYVQKMKLFTKLEHIYLKVSLDYDHNSD
jgi:hypothetical protein